tara:strand:+ start:329 stop:472 length:144 start_codon:yes stop_codon:yes gene_type:complete
MEQWIINFITTEIKNKFPFNPETDCKEKYTEIIQDYLYEEIISEITE